MSSATAAFSPQQGCPFPARRFFSSYSRGAYSHSGSRVGVRQRRARAAPAVSTLHRRQDRRAARSALALRLHRLLRRARRRGDGRALPLPHERRTAAAPHRPHLQAARLAHDARSIAGAADGAPETNVIAGSTRLNVHPPIDATRDWALVRLAQPVCKGGSFKVSRKPVAEVMKLAEAGRVYNVAYHRDLPKWQPMFEPGCVVKRNFEDADWTDDPPRFLRPRSAAAAHLRHRRRLVGLAAAGRRARRARGRRHQRRHLRAVEGDHAQRRGAAPLQVGRRRQHRRELARVRGVARRAARRRDACSPATMCGVCRRGSRERAFTRVRATARFDAETKAAIEGFERASDMPVTGLATQPLLQALLGDEPGRDRQDPRKTGDDLAARRASRGAASFSADSIARSLLLLGDRERRCAGAWRRPPRDARAGRSASRHAAPSAAPATSSRVCALSVGPQQHELAVAILDEAHHLGVAVAGLQPLAHEQAQVARQRRVAVVDRLVLADEAAQARGDGARARLELRVGQDLVGLDGKRGRAREDAERRARRATRCERQGASFGGGGAAGCGARGPARRRAGAGRSATLRRRGTSRARRAR